MSRDLEHIPVLFLDCQTTGANPDKGDVMEIGWACSKNAEHIETFLINLPEERTIPKRVQSVTGITPEDMNQGHSVDEVWSRLLDVASRVAQDASMDACPTVIHFSKFEEQFLHHLHEQTLPDSRFPFRIICTHEIARRIFPCLPRRGIRAISGYFGFSIGEYRRCHDHVAATVVIWQNMTAILREKHNVTTFEGLLQWLDTAQINTQAERIYPMECSIRKDLPDRPGVYRMLRSEGDILYIGKARSLKKRVNSYFRKRGRLSDHILEMLSQARTLDVTETGSALEAAILESDEIKEHAPPYNIALRARERGIWFASTDFSQCGRMPDSVLCVGPFSSSASVATVRSLIQVIAEPYSAQDENLLRIGFGVPEAYGPDMRCIQDGFEIFRARHEDALYARSVTHALCELGKRFWLEHKEESEITDEEEQESETSMEWTPESCAHIIESNIRRITHEIRRARWLTWITESSLCWEGEDTRVLMIFENGAVAFRDDIARDEEIPVPPGHKRRFQERQHCFDLCTFDRMRVVTTEIRRLVTTGKHVIVRFDQRKIMNTRQLAMLFSWI
jgi:DNA polymerase-3 subunit epsilon